MITDKINFKQPKYMLPAILYPLLLITGYLVFDIFDTETAEKPNELQTTAFLNPELPQAQIQNDAIGGKYESMVKSYGKIQDYSAVENIDRDNQEEDKEDYDSKYSKDDLALLDMEAAQRTEELQRAQEMQERLRQSAEKGRNLMTDSIDLQPLSEAERLARSKQREQEALAELQKALAEARLSGQKTTGDMMEAAENADNAGNGRIGVKGRIEVNGNEMDRIDDNTISNTVVKLVKKPSDYFHTLAENDPEPKLIKAIIDEDIKAVDGSRVRLRLLDDVEIGELVVPKGAYLYATMSGFGSQRVKGNVKSLMVADELVKLSLALYDTDGLEGLYVPGSTFRETTKDVASSALGSNVSMNNGTGGNSFTQWGMQAVQNAYQRTSNAISKSVKKNKAKLKYGTFVYLVNEKEKKSTER
jgi:conjugative transposon TraM protein